MTESSSTLKPKKLTLSYKVIWGIASLGTSLISGIYGGLLTSFYQDYLGVTAKWIGIAAIVYAIWNALNDPIFGYITDNTRSKHGRRIPYMRYTAPFLALTFILVWFAPDKTALIGDQRQLVLFAWMLGSMLLYDTAYTIIGLVYSALLPEVTESDSERNGLQISSSLFAMLGTVLGFLIPDMVRPKAGTDTSLWPLRIAMIVVAIVGMLLIMATTFKVKERKEFTRVDKPLGLWKSIGYTFSSKSFLILVAANFMSILMSSLILGSMFYLADYVMQMAVIILLIFIFIPLIIGIPLTSVIRKKLGVVGAQQLLLIIAGIGLIAVAFVPKNLIPICLIMAGFGLSGPQTLTNVLFAQVADEDEIRTGVRREGAFFGVNALLTKPAQSVALWIVPAILEATKFVTRASNAGETFVNQPATAVFGIKAFIGIIPGVACILGAILLIFYPLKGNYLKQVQEKVLEMHAEKAQKLSEMQN
jgi:GPH family glycoside/pentoside/hexuronide:cation symporter